MDDDGRGGEVVEYISTEEGGVILDLVAELNVDLVKFLAFMRVESLEKMPKSEYAKAISALNTKKEKAVKK
jgi:hypothetical protein